MLGVATLSVGADNKNARVKLGTSLVFIMFQYNDEVCFLRTCYIPDVALCAVDADLSWGVCRLVPADHMLPLSVPRKPILRSGFCFFTLRPSSDFWEVYYPL